ncbi:MAG: hypothetical protein GEU86_10730 [Actinophytocola sp.]|nr:hypothetical protein [Actinophytocola sp.]
MRERWCRPALPVAAALLCLTAAPAAAQNVGESHGGAVADASTAVGMLRLLPGSVPGSSVLPALAAEVGEASAFEAGYGISSAQIDTHSPLAYERVIAQATPYGTAQSTSAPAAPDALVQTAVPDNPKASTEALRWPPSATDALVSAGPLTGKVHARWGDDTGPCVGVVSDARTDTEDFTMGNAVPTVPDLDFGDLALPGKASPPSWFRPGGGLGTLGGLLSTAEADDGRSLVRVPGGISTESKVELVDLPRSERKAVRSTSTARAKTITLFPGSALAMTATLTRRPALTVTATGSEASKVDHTTPEITVKRSGKTLFKLSARKPNQDIPIGIPQAGLRERAGKAKLAPLPIIGGAAETTTGRVVRLGEKSRREVTDLFILRVGVGGLNTTSDETNTPFAGTRLGASARLLDVQLLPTEALAKALAGHREEASRYEVPSTLLQFSIGEQVAHALVPEGGARCGSAAGSSAPSAGTPASMNAGSSAATIGVPMLWIGAVALLAGVVLLVVVPRRGKAARPSPRPRE